MAATPRIIVVGGGLAGLSAVIKIAEAGRAIGCGFNTGKSKLSQEVR